MAEAQPKALPRIFSSNVIVYAKTDDATTFRVLGVPYYGPESLGFKDFHGEFFSKSTDFAMTNERVPLVTNVISFYDHAYNENVGTDPIGTAKFVEETDKGQVWDIEIRRAYRYLDMLELMASKGLLGASSQPVQSAVKVNWDTGHIEKWPVAEMSLTPTPANPLAVASVMKSFGFEMENNMGASKDPTEVQKKDGGEVVPPVTPPVEPPVTPPAPPAPEPTPEPAPAPEEDKGEDVPSLEDEINGAFNQEQPSAETLEVAKAIQQLVKSVADLSVAVAEIKTTVVASDERGKAVVLEVAGVRNGLKALAQNVAKNVGFAMTEEMLRKFQQPADEREAEDTVKKNISNFIPDNAPGFVKAGSR